MGNRARAIDEEMHFGYISPYFNDYGQILHMYFLLWFYFCQTENVIYEQIMKIKIIN